ncbi:MAG: hypothetical protein Q9220_003775 [cf. Caloplaca sp. 1 TL-2023]
MINTSPYDLIESAPPEWRPQEDRAASAFVGISFFLFLETIFEIFRVFKKRRGLYFWSLLIGVIAIPINNIAILLKYLVPGTLHIWPLYTLLALSSWTCYSLAQLVILYSRLHLVLDSPRVQRWVLYLIFACAVLFVIPIWIVVWPAWNIDEEITKRWSPVDGIVERFTQLGFTMAECAVSGIYIHSLYQLLHWKPTVRQRRVFLDLVYVNAITIALDILAALLVYLNQTGTSHPIQIFSYALKFRLEFVVLNQLMAVAARGVRRETFGEKRYHNDSIGNNSYFDANNGLPSSDVVNRPEQFQESLKQQPSSSSAEDSQEESSSRGETEIKVPAPALEKVSSRSKSQAADDGGAGARIRALVRSLRPGSSGPADDEGSVTVNTRRKSSRGTSDDDDDDEEIPLHMWERNGEIVMRIPWFKDAAGRRGDDV